MNASIDAGMARDIARADRKIVRDIVRASRTSFMLGMRMLPRPRREAMEALYALCRALDDVADGPGPADQKRASLARWRGEIHEALAGRATHPLTRTMAEAALLYDLPAAEFDAMVDGMEEDVDRPPVAPSLESLRRYCRRVAGTVGVLSVRIFGVGDGSADPFAEALGEALQLTNILRDVGEDAAMGRLYLPREVLAAAGVASPRLPEALRDPALPAACALLAERAEEKFAAAHAAIPPGAKRRLLPALIMMAIYQRLLARLRQTCWKDLDQRVRVPTLEKLGLALRAILGR